MRTITIDNDKLSKILKERGIIFKQVGEINEQIVELDKERTKLGYQMDKLKEKTATIIEKYKDSFNIGKYEIIASVGINDNRENEVTIIDQVEEYQKMLDEKLTETK